MPGTVRELQARLLERVAHHFEVGAEDLEHDLAAHAGHRLLDVVLDRLREVVAHARDLGQRRAHLVDQAVLVVALAPFVARLAGARRSRSCSGSRCRCRPRGGRARESTCATSGKVRMRLRTSTSMVCAASSAMRRRHLDEHHEVALVELGQELGAEPRAAATPSATRNTAADAEHERAARRAAAPSQRAVAHRAAARSSAAPAARPAAAEADARTAPAPASARAPARRAARTSR